MTAPEQWRAIPGHEGQYDVSDHGRIRSWLPWKGSTVPRIVGTPSPQGLSAYPIVKLCGDASATRVHVHVAAAFLGPRPPGLLIRHLDGNPLNNHATNLRYGTVQENAQDAVRHGDDPQTARTHCPAGHPYNAENTRIRPRGDGRTFRQCLLCQRQNSRESARRRRLRDREFGVGVAGAT